MCIHSSLQLIELAQESGSSLSAESICTLPASGTAIELCNYWEALQIAEIVEQYWETIVEDA